MLLYRHINETSSMLVADKGKLRLKAFVFYGEAHCEDCTQSIHSFMFIHSFIQILKRWGHNFWSIFVALINF